VVAIWHGVELRHLAALTAVGEERSFRGAAERLGYVQSAVSQQISQFESLVGQRLIERERGHAAVALTDAGDLVFDHAERVFAQLRAARADLASLAEGDASQLVVGATESVAARLLPSVLAELDKHGGSLQVTVAERASDSGLFEAVESGELDLAICELPAPAGPFSVRELLTDRCVLLVAAGLNGARPPEPVSLEDVARMALVGHPSWRFGELVEAHFRACGLELSYAAEAETNSATQALVAGGRATAAIMPSLAVDRADPRTEALELDGALPPRTLARIAHSGRRSNDAIDAFDAAARQACARGSSSIASPRALSPR
jgi:DNA-binding transcriptional LysR family regulator